MELELHSSSIGELHVYAIKKLRQNKPIMWRQPNQLIKESLECHLTVDFLL